MSAASRSGAALVAPGKGRRLELTAALALSWIGLYLHNLQELGLPLWRPENSAPFLIAAGLAVAWSRRSSRRLRMALMAWAWLQLIGGALLSILPLGIYPIEPEQSLSHYGSHLLYGLLQLPLLIGALLAEEREAVDGG